MIGEQANLRQIEQDEHTKVVTVTINSFKIYLVDDRAVLGLLALLSERDYSFTDKVGQRLLIDSKGALVVLAADPWFNPMNPYGRVIGTASELSILLEPYCAKWIH